MGKGIETNKDKYVSEKEKKRKKEPSPNPKIDPTVSQGLVQVHQL